MTLTITHQGSSSTSGVAGGLPIIGSTGLQTGSNKGLDTGNIFGSLLATLFSLTAPQGETPEVPKLTDENLDVLSKALLTLQQSLEGDLPEASAIPVTPTIIQPVAAPLELIANLIDTLENLAATSEKGVTLNPGAIERATTAVDTITQLLSAAADSKALSPQPLTQIGAATVPATIAPAKAVIPPTIDSAQKAPLPIPAATELTRLAENLKQAAPALSAKLNELANKLQQLAPPPPTTQIVVTEDAEINQLLQSLIGEKQVTGKQANLPLEGEKQVIRGLDNATQKTPAPINAPKLDVTATRVLANEAQPAKAEPAHKPNAAATTLAGAAASAPIAKTERGPQSDPLLLAQTIAQPSARPDSAIAIKPAAAAYQAQSQAPNLPNIAFQIAQHHAAGLSKFQIRMDPPEMGKIDVRLNVDHSGNLHARLTVERPETLDLLQRDARTLEKALQQAGLENRSTNLEFSLRQNPFAGQNGQSGNGHNENTPQFSLDDDADTPIVDLQPAIYYRGTASPGGVNMFA